MSGPRGDGLDLTQILKDAGLDPVTFSASDSTVLIIFIAHQPGFAPQKNAAGSSPH